MARKVLCTVHLLIASQLGLGSLACCLGALLLTLSGLSGRYLENMGLFGGLTDTRDVICFKNYANLLFSSG